VKEKNGISIHLIHVFDFFPFLQPLSIFGDGSQSMAGAFTLSLLIGLKIRRFLVRSPGNWVFHQ